MKGFGSRLWLCTILVFTPLNHLICLFSLAIGTQLSLLGKSIEIEQRIVKISAVQQSHSLTHPWRRNSSKEVSGSGLVFKGGRILTNADVVKNARQLYIQPYQSSLKIEAEVVAIAYKMDLALVWPVG